MTNDSEVAATVAATLARFGLLETELGRPGETMRRRGATADAGWATLPTIAVGRPGAGNGAGAGPAEYVSTREIGRGGMGVIHAAEQRALGREVALKTTLSPDPEVVRALVREARLMGALEHPSVVPIHALGVDADGSPLLVMKRIEGVTWRELMQREDHPAWAPLLVGHGDRLRAHVDILSQVSRALAFAHERGVIHRDLKPDNVMVGAFGEIYLLDWGIALRLTERGGEPEGIVGTPGYMAPEMALGDPTQLDPRTDVYLLGATLYEVLAGQMPHHAASAVLSLVAAVSGRVPEVPRSAPAELVTLLRSAMASAAGDRPPRAEAFREGLAHYLASREVHLLCEGARAALVLAEGKLAEEGPGSPAALRALIEARFALSSAQRMRPDDPDIVTQLEMAVVALVERELELRNPGAARAHLADLAAPPPGLVNRIESLERDVDRERSAAAEHAVALREADPSAMLRPMTRAYHVSWFVVVPLGVWFAWRAAQSGQGFPARDAVAFDLGSLLLFGVLLLVGRRQFFATGGSRQLTLSYTVWIGSMALADIVTLALGRNTNEATVHSMTTGLVVTTLVTLTIMRDLWPAIVVYLLTVAALFMAPRYSPVFATLQFCVNIPICVRAFRRQAHTRKASA